MANSAPTSRICCVLLILVPEMTSLNGASNTPPFLVNFRYNSEKSTKFFTIVGSDNSLMALTFLDSGLIPLHVIGWPKHDLAVLITKPKS
ncbi:unnamed protein product [Ceratitis capitata]|uniref:(Mediterranean fruit fly) hypothetical protein n=1 Tax=Ceratitis capitata TaxID=7213 RepID=A0A811UVH2_CERCA|nr:unnamed protein product [Ceratitis capitata]